jgi:hypothetical protein
VPQFGPVLFRLEDRRLPLPGQILEAVGVEQRPMELAALEITHIAEWRVGDDLPDSAAQRGARNLVEPRSSGRLSGRVGRQDRKGARPEQRCRYRGQPTWAPMPDGIAYHDGFDLNTAEPLRVEVLAIHGGPVTLTASIPAAVETIHLTPDQARRLAGLLARASIAAGGRFGQQGG